MAKSLRDLRFCTPTTEVILRKILVWRELEFRTVFHDQFFQRVEVLNANNRHEIQAIIYVQLLE